jgi:hypothetical protein
MNEAEARDLAQEINRHPGWWAHAEIVNIHQHPHEWWVQAHHESMRASPSRPYPTLPITSREVWDAARLKWGNP